MPNFSDTDYVVDESGVGALSGVPTTLEGPHLSTLVGSHAERLGVDYDTAMYNLEDFSEKVGMIENSGKTVGKNPTSSAKGLYQFINSSVEPAVNRLAKYIGMQEWMKEAVEHKDANKLSREEQRLLFLGDLLEKRGSDELMRGVMEGDEEAMYDAYSKLHHTNMNEESTKNASKYFSN